MRTYDTRTYYGTPHAAWEAMPAGGNVHHIMQTPGGYVVQVYAPRWNGEFLGYL